MKNLFGRFAILLAICLLSQVSWAQKKKNKNQVWFEEAPTLPFSFEGVYKGTIPCVDCQGMQTVIFLEPNNAYKMETQKIGVNSKQSESGTYLWKKEGNYLVLVNASKPTDSTFLLLSKDRLTVLDKKGKRYSGANAANYILVKDSKGISGKYLRLVELNRKPLPTANRPKEPFIYLDPQSNNFNGNGGCNSLMGNYEMGTGTKITFSNMVSMMMACADLQTEEDIRLALESTDHFVVKGDMVIMENALNQAQAKFQIDFLK